VVGVADTVLLMVVKAEVDNTVDYAAEVDILEVEFVE